MAAPAFAPQPLPPLTPTLSHPPRRVAWATRGEGEGKKQRGVPEGRHASEFFVTAKPGLLPLAAEDQAQSAEAQEGQRRRLGHQDDAAPAGSHLDIAIRQTVDRPLEGGSVS